MRRAVIAGLGVVVALVLVWKLACQHGSNDARTASKPRPAASAAAPGTRAARAPATPAALSGRVTRRDGGAPIAGAVIAIASKPEGSRTGAPDAPSTVVVADASGAWSAPAIAPGSYHVTASAVGFLPASTPALAVAAGERKDRVDLALASGGTTVSGTVTDIGGGAIAGARVTMRPSGTRSTSGMTEEVVALSGDDGSYRLTLPAGDCAAAVTHDDYTRGSKWFRVTATPLVVDFVLAPGATIRGQVVASDGTPVAGAEVTSRAERRGFDGYGRAVADADGKFTLKGIGSGALALTASARGYASKNPTKLTVGVGEQVDDVKVLVDHGFSISGTILDATTRKGIAGAHVAAYAIPNGGAGSAEPTGADGAFEITGLGRGNYFLSVTSEGVMPEFGKHAEVRDQDVTGIVIEMTAGVRLSGRIEPPVATSLRLEPELDKMSRGKASTAKVYGVSGDSDPATGTFVLEQVPPGEFSLIATHADGRTGKLAVTVADRDRSDLVVTLEPRASIAGKVVDAGGAAVPGVQVAASPDAPGLPRSAARIALSQARDAVVTGADGAFQIVGLEAGKLELAVRDAQGVLAPAHGDKLAEVELTRGQALTGLVLTVEPRDGTITGRVLGADGKPAADAWVTATYQGSGTDAMEARLARALGTGLPALTSADGRFALDHLHRGSYQLVVDGPRGTSRAEATAKVGDDVTITLATLGALSGRVTAGGTPVRDYDLDCRIAGPRRFSLPGSGDAFNQHVTADDGTYSAEHIVSGSYTCTIASDRGTANDTIAISSGPVQHDFALVAYASVTGTVVDATTGQPRAGITVLNMLATGAQSISAMMSGNGPKTDASGRFELTGQPLGDGRLMMLDGNTPVMPQPASATRFTLTAGQRLDLGTIKVADMSRSLSGRTSTSTLTPR
ncbi:MAG TPA: carboxypeptidase regulatory-like domain-containing protein [Kofleriaceae bacterium]|nr:carboxypeptidase regulatory-like domain-containing protein [Kofleriaceae bacterium]